MFDRILSPLDGSSVAECVLPHLSAFARAFNSNILVLRVLDKNQSLENTRLFDLVNWQINKTSAKMYVDKVSDRLKETGLKVESDVLEGSVAEIVIDVSRERGINLIVLSSHGKSGTSQWGVSNVTQKIIFRATTSVLVIRASEPPDCEIAGLRYENILVPLDGSKRAELVLPMAVQLARYHKSKIHIANVVKPPEMPRQLPLTQEEKELAEKINNKNREEAIRYLEQIKQQSPWEGVEVQTHLVLNENAAIALHELTGQEKIDLVTLSAHGYSGNTSWPYGSLVNNFILYSKLPLLIVQDKPSKEESVHPNMTPREHPEH